MITKSTTIEICKDDYKKDTIDKKKYIIIIIRSNFMKLIRIYTEPIEYKQSKYLKDKRKSLKTLV